MREFLARLLSLFSKTRRERDLEAEMQTHLALAIEENQARGMTEAEAKRAAILRFGGWETAKEEQRDARSLPLFEHIAQDLHYGLRAMRREPGFTVFALLIIALGIGASATVFSVLNTVLLRPLPFRDPGRLVWIGNAPPGSNMSDETLQVNRFLSFRERNRSFSDIAAYFAFYGKGDSQLQINGGSERLNVLPVSHNFFPLLGIQPVFGRQFNALECKWNGPKAVLLSYGLWKQRFAADAQIVGKTIRLDNSAVTVVGILPASFDFGVFVPGTHMDAYVPFPLTEETDHWGNTLAVIGRLKKGITVEQARAEALILGKQISAEPHRGNDLRPYLLNLRDSVSGRIRPALLVLGFAVAAVMLIVCANLANLLLARGTSRQKELAIRSALGAGTKRLIFQTLTESLLLSLLGGVAGAILAWMATGALAHLTSFNIPLLPDVRLDGTALLFIFLLTVVSGVLFGSLPALQVPRLAVNESLKDQHRGSSASSRHSGMRGALVILEVAFACVLLTGTGLLIRSFVRLLDVNLGFQPARAASLRIDSSSKQFSTNDQANAWFNEVLRRVRELPGVEAAGLIDALPLSRNRTWGAAAPGVVYKRDNYPEAFVHIVTDGYLGAAGIALSEGRDFSARDTPHSEPVILINETLARSTWPGQDALGKFLVAGPGKARRVVGIVKDVHHLGPEEASGSEMYFSIRQLHDYGSVQLVVRSRLDPKPLTAGVRRVLLPIDTEMPNEQFQPLEQLVDRSVSPRRFVVWLLSAFALFALILASLGIYAVIAYSVGQRTQEIGIRMALGATPGELQKQVLSQTMLLAGTGLVIGTTAAFLAMRALQGLLFDVKANDPATFVAMIAVLLAVAFAAGFLPAHRASRIDPAIALRTD